MHSFQIGHHRPHHTSGKSAFQEQRRHMLVGRVHKITQKIVNELLCHGTGFHVGFHINLRHLKSRVFQHSLHGDYVRMNFPPRDRLHCNINNIRAILTNFEDRSHRKPRSAMSVILDDDFGMPFLDCFRQTSQHFGATDTCHIFQTDFRCTGLYQTLGNGSIIFYGMHGRERNA